LLLGQKWHRYIVVPSRPTDSYLAAGDSTLAFDNMKNLFRSLFLVAGLFAATLAFGGIPSVSVTVSDAGGNAAFKGATNTSGAFATANLKPGNYVVQFNSSSAAMKGNFYALVVSAGKKKVSANAVPGEKFSGGGVAMKVDVGSGLNISGIVASEEAGAIRNGKTMVWIPPMLGSNMPGHWAEKGSADEVLSRTRGNVRTDAVQSLQDKGYAGPGR
jgi:hypothetical protein